MGFDWTLTTELRCTLTEIYYTLVSYAAPYWTRQHPAWDTQHPAEISRTLLSKATTLLSYAATYSATPHPTELRRTLLSYATPAELPCTLLSYAPPCCATPHPAKLPVIYLNCVWITFLFVEECKVLALLSTRRTCVSSQSSTPGNIQILTLMLTLRHPPPLIYPPTPKLPTSTKTDPFL